MTSAIRRVMFGLTQPGFPTKVHWAKLCRQLLVVGNSTCLPPSTEDFYEHTQVIWTSYRPTTNIHRMYTASCSVTKATSMVRPHTINGEVPKLSILSLTETTRQFLSESCMAASLRKHFLCCPCNLWSTSHSSVNQVWHFIILNPDNHNSIYIWQLLAAGCNMLIN